MVHGRGLSEALASWRRKIDYDYWTARLRESFRFKAVAQLARQLGVERRVIFHGYVRDPIQLLGRMSIGVLCSLSEGLPHALVEFMAAGRPVVATDVGGTRHLLEDGRSGRLVPPQDAGSLADALAAYLGDPEGARRAGQAGRAVAERRFRIGAVVDRTLDVYEEVLALADASRA